MLIIAVSQKGQGQILTKDEVGIVIKRYRFIIRAIKENLPQAVFYSGKRKQIIEITEEVKSICKFIQIIYENEVDEWVRSMIKCLLQGRKDTYIIRTKDCSKNLFYARKSAFLEKLFNLCIYNNLVTYEEILEEKIA